MSRRTIYVCEALFLALSGAALCAGCGTQVGIAAVPSEIYVEVDGTATVNVVAIMDTGSTAAVTGPLTSTSSDEASALSSGVAVLGVAEGTAAVTITDGVFTTSATVNVVAAGTLPTELVVTPTSVFCTPESDDLPLEVFAVFATGEGEDITDRAAFSSSDSSIALVTAGGVVVCVAEGQAAITAQYLGVADSIEVAVGRAPPRAVSFSSSALTCEAGESPEVQVLASWADGSTTDVTLSAMYSSSDGSVALASAGQVQCLSEGSAMISANVEGVTGTLNVAVGATAPDPNELVDLRISPSSIDCSLAQPASFAVIAEFGDGSTEDVSGSSETQFGISDNGVLLLLGGEVICVQEGQATLQATFRELVALATVTVR